MQPIYPLPVACFLDIPYPLIGSEGMLTPQPIPGATVPGLILWSIGSAHFMPGLRCDFITSCSSTCLGSVCIGAVESPRTWFGNRNEWSPDRPHNLYWTDTSAVQFGVPHAWTEVSLHHSLLEYVPWFGVRWYGWITSDSVWDLKWVVPWHSLYYLSGFL